MILCSFCALKSLCSICFSFMFEPDTSVFFFSIYLLVVCACLSISFLVCLAFLSSLTTVKVVVPADYLCFLDALYHVLTIWLTYLVLFV